MRFFRKKKTTTTTTETKMAQERAERLLAGQTDLTDVSDVSYRPSKVFSRCVLIVSLRISATSPSRREESLTPTPTSQALH